MDAVRQVRLLAVILFTAAAMLMFAGCGSKSDAANVKQDVPVKSESAADGRQESSVKSEPAADVKPAQESVSDGEKLLEDYNKFLDGYLAAIKKIIAGDQKAAAEAPQLSKDLDNWGAKFNKAVADGTIDVVKNKECVDRVVASLNAIANSAKPSTASKSGTAGDKLLDDYDKFLDGYIAVKKRINANDVSAIVEAQKAMIELNNWNVKFNQAMADGTINAVDHKAKISSIDKKLGIASGKEK